MICTKMLLVQVNYSFLITKNRMERLSRECHRQTFKITKTHISLQVVLKMETEKWNLPYLLGDPQHPLWATKRKKGVRLCCNVSFIWSKCTIHRIKTGEDKLNKLGHASIPKERWSRGQLHVHVNFWSSFQIFLTKSWRTNYRNVVGHLGSYGEGEHVTSALWGDTKLCTQWCIGESAKLS